MEIFILSPRSRNQLEINEARSSGRFTLSTGRNVEFARESMWTKCLEEICAKTCNGNPFAKAVLSCFNGRLIMTIKGRQKSSQ
jgi:hypothetical protein